jgi:segregation and condensation protein B
MSEEATIKSIIEAILFANDKPVLVEQIKNDLFQDLEPSRIRDILNELKSEYENQNRGLRIVEVAGGFQMVTSPTFADYLKKFYRGQKKERLSRPTLETLAIIAYKQPVTKLQIKSIRGVDIDGIINSLKEAGMIRTVGRRRAPGRPFLYGTTRQFLEHFGLKSLEDLPNVENFSKMEAANESKEVPQENRQD